MYAILSFLRSHASHLAVCAIVLFGLARLLGLGRAGRYSAVGALVILNISDNASAGLKDWYSMVYEDAAWRDNVFLGMVPKEAAYGQQITQSIKIGRTSGHGADIASAITNQSSESRKKFNTPWGKSYAVENVDNTEIDVSEEDDGAIVQLLGDAMEGCMRKVSEDLEFDCFGDGFGSRGNIASTTGSGPYVITFSQQWDSIKWNVGDVGVSSLLVNSASLRTGSFTASAIDTDAGTMTVTANGGWTPTNGDFLFFTADKIAGSLTTPLKVLGLKFWIPLTATSGVDATGVDRGVDVNKLQGTRIDCRGMDPKQAVNALLTSICINRSANPKAILCSPFFYQAYEDSLQNAAIYDKTSGAGDAANTYFDGIKHMGPKGPVVVYSAPGCDADRFYAIDWTSWILRAPKNKAVKMAGRAGKDGLIDVGTADAVQIRMKYLANVSCSFPGANGVGRLV